MAPRVRNAFQDLYLSRTPGADEDAVQAWLQDLIDRRRYVGDVYAG